MKKTRNRMGIIGGVATLVGWMMSSQMLPAQQTESRDAERAPQREAPKAAPETERLKAMMRQLSELNKTGKQDQARQLMARIHAQAGNNPRIAAELGRIKRDWAEKAVAEERKAAAERREAAEKKAAAARKQAAEKKATAGKDRTQKERSGKHGLRKKGGKRQDRLGADDMVAEIRKLRQEIEMLRDEVRRMRQENNFRRVAPRAGDRRPARPAASPRHAPMPAAPQTDRPVDPHPIRPR